MTDAVVPQKRSRMWLWIVLGLVAFGFVSCGGLVVLAVMTTSKGDAGVPAEGVLVLKVDGEYPDYLPQDPLLELLTDQPIVSFNQLLTDLRKAKADPRVKAVLLRFERFGAGWGKAEELRAAIRSLRDSGKPVYAELGEASNLEYFIATACEKIWMPPSGHLFINGLAAEVTFFRGTLDKLGVFPDVFQIGKYKNAPDSFTRQNMTEPHREVMNVLLDHHFEQFVTAIAEARNLKPEQVKQLIDKAPMVAPEALEAKLLDELLYPLDIEERLATQLNVKDEDGGLQKIRASQYREVTPQSVGLEQGPKIALIFASGAIGQGESEDDGLSGQSTGSDTVVRALEKAREDDSIRAVVMRVNSPGGSAFASDLIWAAVEKVKKTKPVVVSMGDVAASGGYYIAANANRIVADPSTLTGSIGIFAGKPVIKDLYEKLGINAEYLLRGEHAGMFRETEPFTESERARFESIIRHTYENDFIAKVAEGRERDAEYVHSVAQGRVWTGLQAKEKGLVDEIGGLEHAIAVAKGLAKLPEASDPQRVILPTPKTFLESLFSPEETVQLLVQHQAKSVRAEAIPSELRGWMGYRRIFEAMKRGEAMALLPYEVRIR